MENSSVNLHRLVKCLICFLLAELSPHPAIAATVRFQSWTIDIPAGWNYAVEETQSGDDVFTERISISSEVGGGTFNIISYDSPIIIDEQALRNFTNVDASIPLELQEWGDFAGYYYSYSESGSNFRQWWLSSGSTLLILVYESEVVESTKEIDGMVASLMDASNGDI